MNPNTINLHPSAPSPQTEPVEPVAWIGLDWGDQQHAFALQDRRGTSESGTIAHAPETLHPWLVNEKKEMTFPAFQMMKSALLAEGDAARTRLANLTARLRDGLARLPWPMINPGAATPIQPMTT